MTKDGRPSRINNIRLFVGERRMHRYLEGQEEAVAFARRLAYFLNGEGFSLGAHPALYVLFTQSLDPGDIRVTNFGGDWWQRYTDVGVTADSLNKETAFDVVKAGIVGALKKNRPDLETMIDNAAEIVHFHGDALRLLARSKESKKFVVDVSFTLSSHPKPSNLFVSLTDRSTREYFEALPVPMLVYNGAFALSSSVRVSTSKVTLSPGKSIFAKLNSMVHGGSIETEISEFHLCPRPEFSKLIKPRG